jgi:hypothetical protein
VCDQMAFIGIKKPLAGLRRASGSSV